MEDNIDSGNPYARLAKTPLAKSTTCCRLTPRVGITVFVVLYVLFVNIPSIGIAGYTMGSDEFLRDVDESSSKTDDDPMDYPFFKNRGKRSFDDDFFKKHRESSFKRFSKTARYIFAGFALVLAFIMLCLCVAALVAAWRENPYPLFSWFCALPCLILFGRLPFMGFLFACEATGLAVFELLFVVLDITVTCFIGVFTGHLTTLKRNRKYTNVQHQSTYLRVPTNPV